MTADPGRNTTRTVRIVSQYFYPDIANTGQLLTELAAGFAENGIVTEVVTARPSYDNTIDAPRSEVYRGIRILRVPAIRWDKNTVIGKIANAVSFFTSALFALLMSPAKSPLLIVSNPPFLPLLGVILKKFRGIEFVYLVHDIYPDIAVRLGYLKSGGFVEKMWHVLNRHIFRSAARVIVLGESMRAVVAAKAGFGPANESIAGIAVIYNWADGDFLRPRPIEQNPFVVRNNLAGKFIIQYSGNMGLFHDLECLIETARLIRDPDCCFLLIGSGGKKPILEAMTERYRLANVRFMGYQDRSVLPDSLTAAHCSVVTLERGIEGLAMPSKLATILAAGVPVIAFCDQDSEIARIIHEAGCGYSLVQGDVRGLERIIHLLREDPKLREELGRNARTCYEKHFTFKIALQRYIDVLMNIPARQSRDVRPGNA